MCAPKHETNKTHLFPLLKSKYGSKIDIKVPLRAWSWDMGSGVEFRVGAGLAEPYANTWCAVEYFESSGTNAISEAIK
ncbi:hypothetical protein R6Q57_026704 [Mikania cordata]